MAKITKPMNLEQLEEEAISVMRTVAGTGLVVKIQYHNKELRVGVTSNKKHSKELNHLVTQNKELLLEFMHAKLKHLKEEQHYMELLFDNQQSNYEEYRSFTNSDLTIRQIYRYNTCISYPNICSGYYGCYGCADISSRMEEMINYVR